MYIIGIDIGTGSTKAVALEPSGDVISRAQVAYPTQNSVPGISEQVPEIVWQAFLKCISRITSALPDEPVAICISSAMHSLIPVGEDGTPLANMITWADNRSSEVAAKLKNAAYGKKLYEETGTPIHAMSPLCKIIWLRENNPSLFEKTARFISIKEFIWHRIFAVFEVDYAIASATGLFNINTLEWHTEALALAGITAIRLSMPVNTTTFRSGIEPDVASHLHISQSVPFMIGGSDGCLANVGSYATKPGIAALTIGTSGAIRVAMEKPALNWEQMTFNYRLNEKLFISGGPINNGGIALKWYGENLLGKALNSKETYSELLAALTTVSAGADGLIFLPYLFGERAPIWNSNACGVFFGFTGQHRQEHFTKAVVEGILFSLYQIMRGIEADGRQIDQIHVSGGFIRSAAWVQLLATIFGKKVVLVNQDDASAVGAAYMGFEKLGISGDYTRFDESESVSFFPDVDTHVFYREKVFPLYEHLYRSLSVEMEIRHENKSVKDAYSAPLTAEKQRL